MVKTIELSAQQGVRTVCRLDADPGVPADLIDVGAIREQFPALQDNPDLLFFDNAATTQKPQSVIEVIDSFYKDECGNAGRASYSRSTLLATRVEKSRSAVAGFLNASPPDVAFTSGATDSLNLVATNWGLRNLEDGDEVMICLEDHQSATLPWLNVQSILSRLGRNIKIVPFNMHSSGTYDRKSIQSGLSSRTRLIALAHIHHLYGMEMDLPELREIIPENVLISLDASQSAGHIKIDIEKLGVHFLSLSGHKMFAGNGTGVLWVNSDQRKMMCPVRVGAKTVHRITAGKLEIDDLTLAGMVECGTLNLPGIFSFVPAIQFLQSIGQERVEQYLSVLTNYLHKRLQEVPGIEFAPGIGVCHCTRGYGIISFRLTNVDSGDLAAYLDGEGMLVRTGDHCQASRTSDEYFARVSLHVYNTLDEIEHFVETLRNAVC